MVWVVCSCASFVKDVRGVVAFFFFFKQKTAYEMRISDWSSDVCSSDLHRGAAVWVDLEVEVGRAATGVAGVADEADDLTWLDQLAVVHALGEGAEVGVVVVRAALALDPDLGAAEHVAAHAGDDPPLTGQQRSARWGEDVGALVGVLVAGDRKGTRLT